MNKKELIELLSQYPDDTPVLFFEEVNWDTFEPAILEKDNVKNKLAIFYENGQIELDGDDVNKKLSSSNSKQIILIGE